ncbi:hypothetical protein EOD42_04535 [Rhodovarius crocodyli]|uniref:Sugar ABC transporter permease n=1 Tax=Rhodovarius crocodyli TaxID=1979269 RepID=A0A437MNY6_9PROT|nr:hypothetical protein [Rhodovarius crocodyli]RVT99361.1 hypothetical protein EOD42_04535 [Rhodovarius crocodyli]
MQAGERPIAAPSGLRRFHAALQLQLRVIGALLLRELHTRFGRHHGGYVWMFFEPMLLAACIAGLHTVLGHHLPGDMDIPSFYLTGYVPYYLFRGIINRSGSALLGNAPLFFHKQVTYLDVIIARNALEILSVLFVQNFLLYLVGVFTGTFPDNPAQVSLGVLLIGLFCHGVSMAITAATVIGTEEVDRVTHPMTYLMIPLVGAFSMIWWFPSDMQAIMMLNPTMNMFEYIREGHFGPMVPYHYDMTFMVSSVIAANFFGLFCLRAAGNKYPYLADV